MMLGLHQGCKTLLLVVLVLVAQLWCRVCSSWWEGVLHTKQDAAPAWCSVLLGVHQSCCASIFPAPHTSTDSCDIFRFQTYGVPDAR